MAGDLVAKSQECDGMTIIERGRGGPLGHEDPPGGNVDSLPVLPRGGADVFGRFVYDRHRSRELRDRVVGAFAEKRQLDRRLVS